MPTASTSASTTNTSSHATTIAPLPGESVADTLKRLRSLKGVRAVLLLDERGACVHSAGVLLSAAGGGSEEEQRYAALVQQVTRRAAKLMAVLEEEEEDEEEDDDNEDEGGAAASTALQLVRLRSANHEVVISPVGGYCLAVITEAGRAAAAGGIGGE